MQQVQAPKGYIDNVVQINKRFLKACGWGSAGYLIYQYEHNLGELFFILQMGIAIACYYKAWGHVYLACRWMRAYEMSQKHVDNVKNAFEEEKSDGLASIDDLRKGGVL